MPDLSLIPDISANAIAVLTVDIAQIQSVFTFKKISESDWRYFVNTDYWPTLNAANAMMDHASSANAIAVVYVANKMMVAHDFLRYLALKLFRTHHGVDLFNNETELLQQIRLICGNGAGYTMGEILSSLASVNLSGNHPNIVSDPSGNYMTNDDSSYHNIGRVLVEQLKGIAPERFANLENSSDARPIPFLEDDIVSFSMIINPPIGQEYLTNVYAISPRSYKIRLILKTTANVSNTEVDPNEE
jgi:hypothetical protein